MKANSRQNIPLLNSSPHFSFALLPLSIALSFSVKADIFTTQQDIPFDVPRGVAVLDVDQDSDLDIAVVTYKAGHSAVLINDGLGNFTKDSTSLSNFRAVYVASGDIDQDGIDDLVLQEYYGSTRVLLGDGNGQFIPDPAYEFTYDFEFNTSSIQTADLNADGKLDIVITNTRGANALWMSQADGSFSLQVFSDLSSSTVAMGDVDKDGDIDLIAARYGAKNQVWKNDGQGSFSLFFEFDARRSLDIELADIDGDGDLDAVVGEDYASTLGSFGVWNNDGQGQFSAPASLDLINKTVESIALSDVDQDGDIDIYAGVKGAARNVFYWNDGSGGLTSEQLSIDDNSYVSMLTLTDVNADSYPDLLRSYAAATFHINLNHPEAPLISGASTAQGTETIAFQYSVIQAESGQQLTFSAQNLPHWAMLNTSTGMVYGTPAIGDAGVYDNVLISASDGLRTSTLPPLTITILPSLEAPKENLQAQYPFRFNVDDTISAHHGYAWGTTATADQKSVFGEAFSFDGVDDHLTIPHEGGLDFHGSFTWNIWVKTTMATGVGAIVEVNSSAASGPANPFTYGTAFYTMRGAQATSWCPGLTQDYYFISLHSVGGNNQAFCSPNNSLVPDAWQMLTLTVDDLLAKFYINGAFVASHTTAEQARLAYDYWFGSRPPKSQQTNVLFKGDMSEFSVYDRPLSAEEIDRLYQVTK